MTTRHNQTPDPEGRRSVLMVDAAQEALHPTGAPAEKGQDARLLRKLVPFARPHFDELLKAIEFALKNNYPARGEVA